MRLEALACRTLRFAQAVQALPALHLGARLAAGVACSTPGSCLVQAHVHNMATDPLTVLELVCASSCWQLDGPGSCSLLVAPDMSATLHRQLVPAEMALASSTSSSPRASSSSMTDAEAGLLAASWQAAAAAAAPKHLQSALAGQPQQQQQRQEQRRCQAREARESSLDVVVMWQADGRDGSQPRRGFACLHGLR